MKASSPAGPPVARVEVVNDSYFGETLADPYRWMENDKDADWLPFLKGQNDYTRSVLDAMPTRAEFQKRIEQWSGDIVSTSKVRRVGKRTFVQQRPLGADNFKLTVREGGRDRVLVDPTTMSAAGAGHFSLDWWEPSPDGSHLVYGVSKDGSEDSILHVLTVADGRDMPETIADTEGARPQWLDDGSGFFYTQLTNPVNTPERYLDSQARFHVLGTDPAKDPVLMKRGLDPRVVYDRIQTPSIVTFTGSDHAVLQLGDVRPESRYFVAPLTTVLAGKAEWVEVARFEDEVTGIDLFKGDIYLLANRGTPRGRIARTSLRQPDLARSATVIAQGPQVIASIGRARDGLYLDIMDGGISRLRRLGLDDRVTDVALPFDGTVSAIAADVSVPGILFNLSGWLTPTGVWEFDGTRAPRNTGITPQPKVDVSRYESRRLLVAARDGTRIPTTLICRKDVKLDGGNPLFIQAYGSYGIPGYTPAFAGRTLAFVEAGGIIGYASVRGGGEYGREWHKAGQLKNKPNTWRDLIDVCEELCKLKYTSPAHLAIGGRSAGGITVGRALTERPDLFAAVIDGVGWSNPLRYMVEQNGFGEEPEWGAIGDADGYAALKSIDSYQAVKDGVKYPAVLLTTGVTDPRVAPFHAAKMAARLQAASRSGKPVLLRVDFDAGHGMGSTRTQQDRETADTYAFLMAWAGRRGPLR